MSTPRIGLVLGAGGARGIAHVPVLEALDDLGLKPAAIAGASIGAIVGAGVAAGLSASDVRERFLAAFGTRTSALAKLWQLRPRRISDLMAADNYGLGKLDPLKVLSVFAGDAIPARFSDLAIPFTAVATDFYGGAEVRFSEGDLPTAVAASIALPGLFRPVVIDGRVMVDGGVMNPVPIDALPDDLDFIIAVDVVSFPEPRDDRALPSGLDTVVGSAQLMMQQIMAEKLRQRPPDILVRSPGGPYHALDFLKSRQILEAAAPMREEVKRRLARQIEAPQARQVLIGR
ncbi:MAG: patatin-like phospholipase family protein [Ancalomicrobiaceae bacterium]|nr:patatin-like phospholipase family protein [Ancalomicrobiaceae bacterium]